MKMPFLPSFAKGEISTYVHGLCCVPGGDGPLLLLHLLLPLRPLLHHLLRRHGLEVLLPRRRRTLVLLPHAQQVEGGVRADVLVALGARLADGVADYKNII